MRTRREPASLLPPAAARLIGFALLAALAVAQWARMVEGLSIWRALVWVALGVGAGAAVWASDRLRGRRRAPATLLAAAVALLAAVPAAGIDRDLLLEPRRWDELALGLQAGADALVAVRLPYAGADPWPALTLQLVGALLCVVAAMLALWPRAGATRGYPFFALASLLVLAATPVVSLGGTRPILFGGALAALTVCFLWLERLPLRPGFGVAALLGVALVGALPLAGAADREEAWFDYRAFAEGLGPENPVRFDWEHSYGPIAWPRDRREVLRIRSREPEYWKAEDLDAFDGQAWIQGGTAERGALETTQPPASTGRPEWTRRASVDLRRLRTRDVIGPGTILEVTDSTRTVRPGETVGRFTTTDDLRRGDSYEIRSYSPTPSPEELASSTAGSGGQRADDLALRVPFRAGERPPRATRREGSPSYDSALIRFPAFGEPGEPRAQYPDGRADRDGDAALRRSAYARTWELAQRLRAGARTPAAYVTAVDRFLHREGFEYSEVPAEVPFGTAPLEGFLFDTRSGYCQHYSGAMALLLRMGGVPARVASGFSPGGFSRKRGEWVIRDTDAHSWVEAWFDRYGWVTFDPTPAATPARSQIAALPEDEEDAPDDAAAGGGAGDGAAGPGLRQDLLEDSTGRGTGEGASGPAQDAGGAGRPSPLALAAVLLGLGGAGWLALARLRRRGARGLLRGVDRDVAELERAFRRTGRPPSPGTTLRQLAHVLRDSEEASAYVRGLEAARYGATPAPTTGAQRRAVRQELAYGLGPAGRLRALWALPPRRARRNSG